MHRLGSTEAFTGATLMLFSFVVYVLRGINPESIWGAGLSGIVGLGMYLRSLHWLEKQEQLRERLEKNLESLQLK